MDRTRRFFEIQRTAQYWLIPHRYNPMYLPDQYLCVSVRARCCWCACLFVCRATQQRKRWRTTRILFPLCCYKNTPRLELSLCALPSSFKMLPSSVWSGLWCLIQLFFVFGMCFLWMRCPWLWIVLCAFATMGSTVSGYHYYQCTFAESSFGWVFFWGWWYEGKWIRVWGVGEEGLGFRQLADNVEGDSRGIGIWLQGGTWSLTSRLE